MVNDYATMNNIDLFLLENFISNDSNSCVILEDDDDDDDDDDGQINSKPVNNIEQSEDSIDDDCYCVDITDS
jgi:hypothetical protein